MLSTPTFYAKFQNMSNNMCCGCGLGNLAVVEYYLKFQQPKLAHLDTLLECERFTKDCSLWV